MRQIVDGKLTAKINYISRQLLHTELSKIIINFEKDLSNKIDIESINQLKNTLTEKIKECEKTGVFQKHQSFLSGLLEKISLAISNFFLSAKNENDSSNKNKAPSILRTKGDKLLDKLKDQLEVKEVKEAEKNIFSP